jgi:DNA-binding NarL/FixJ family response regulator
MVILGADPLFVESITPTLSARGIVVVEPHDATAAPDVVLVDGDASPWSRDGAMPVGNPGAKHVLMGGSLDQRNVRAAVQRGFSGVISKSVSLQRFGGAIAAVLEGNVVIEIDPSSNGSRNGHDPDAAGAIAASLTRREREILALLVEGVTGAVMAERLFLSPHTVRTHVQNVMSKLQVHSRLEAVAFAVQHHIVHPSTQDGDR